MTIEKKTTTQVVPLTVAPGRRLSMRKETIEIQKRKMKLVTGFRESVVEKSDQVGKTTVGASTQADDDPLVQLIASGQIVEPPFDLLTLSILPEYSSELNPCVEAMGVGIAAFGWQLKPRIDLKKASPKMQAEAAAEKTKLINFFEYASLEDDYVTLRTQLVADTETIGAFYLEVIRDATGNVQGWEHVPAAHVRLGRQEEKMREVNWPILELQVDGSVEVKTVKRFKRFRTFLQQRHIRRSDLSSVVSHRHTWFKEFGDERRIHNRTGKEITDAAAIADAQTQGFLANELIFLRRYVSRTPYGLPRFIGNLLSIFGDRAAEEINYVTFKNNNIPSMAVLVSNGQLTESTVKRIESFVESQIQGSDNMSKFLIIEAEGIGEEGEDGGHMKLSIEPLTATQHKDAMFQAYSANNRDAIRRSFRLPPILVGRSDDYTRATAETSRKLADEQIFAPERNRWDKWINRRLFPEMGIRYWTFQSNSPNTTDNAELVKILATAEKTGGMTPRIARDTIADVLGRELPDFPEGFDPDLPFSLSMAEAVKNQADAAEPGQQVTAIKMLTGAMETISPDDIADAGQDALTKLLVVRKAVETEWRSMMDTAEIDKNV